MNKNFVTYLVNFILFVVLQVFVLNKICLWECITPMVYILFILSLPFKMPQWAVISVGFLLGMIMDFFTGVIGYHALATLVIAFVRPVIIRVISYREEREEHLHPIFYDMRFIWYLQYVFWLTFIHHFVYFFVDVLSFHNFLRTIIVILSNTVCSLLCIFIIQILFYKSSKRY